MRNRNTFYSQVGKNPYEKEAYKRFISSKFEAEKTEEDPADLNKTDSSSVEDEKSPDKKIIRSKSWWLIVKDWVTSNLGATIVGGLILLAVGNFVNDSFSIEEKISNMEKDIEHISTKQESSIVELGDLKTNFALLKLDFSKEIDFLKFRIGNFLK